MVCRICLATGRRMERVSEELEEAYREVIGIKWERTDQFPQHACWECAARLRGAAGLRRRALASHHLLRDLRALHNSFTLKDIKLIDRSYHGLSSNLTQKLLPPHEYVTRTVDNNQIFTDTKYENNTNYTALDFDTIKTIDTMEQREFANIVNNLLINNTDISIKEIKSIPTVKDINFNKRGVVETKNVNYIDRSEESIKNNQVSYMSEDFNKQRRTEAEYVKDIDREQSYFNNLVPNKSDTQNVVRKDYYLSDDFIKQRITEADVNNIDREKSYFINLVPNTSDTDQNMVRKDFYLSDDFIKQRNTEAEYISDIDRQSDFNNRAPNKSDTQNVVRKDFAVNTDLDEDSGSGCLVIDAEDEPMETVVRSEQVHRTEGGMPIDELIELYSNNGDGDERLQELNQQFEGSRQPGQGWDSGSVGAAATTGPQATETPTRKWKNRRRSKSLDASGQVAEANKAQHYLTKTCNKLDNDLFTITPATDEEQIAEVLKRQETRRYKSAPYKCGLCFRGFSKQQAHAAHVMRHDEINGAYECVVCKIRQKSPRGVRRHMHGLHTVRISCNRCSFVTMNRSRAQGHEKWHAGTVYQCPYCPDHFDQESTFNRHLRTQHVHAHACAYCGLTFVSAKGLAVHRWKRHVDSEKIPLKGPYCPVCGVQFATEESHSTHLKMSSLHRPADVPRYIGLREAGY